ncbi:hypothetical protein BSL78_08381 [Apostichopus japonicus]|uniref:Uncharacterized protein n=1 Tax=Stichopus japonicus TaxID=307972 RepID=A0A2G8L3F2_STIJA|nr:hypothetical protein BSL78_08381 [Apostichopus japonicus]
MARNQHRHETIRQYSLCLEELLQQILKHPSSLPDKDKTLRDRFIEGISSNSIKMELRREVRKDSDINFKDIKDEALELEGAIRMDSAEVITAELHQVEDPDCTGPKYNAQKPSLPRMAENNGGSILQYATTNAALAVYGCHGNTEKPTNRLEGLQTSLQKMVDRSVETATSRAMLPGIVGGDEGPHHTCLQMPPLSNPRQHRFTQTRPVHSCEPNYGMLCLVRLIYTD